MKDPCYIIGISCIGSGVGQSVINSCRLARLPIRTIGLGTNPLAYGLYECDDYAYTASYYADDYVEDMLKTCLEHQIDLLIPGHDDEAHLLSKNLELFEAKGIRVLVSGAELLGLCREKDEMSRELNPVANIFVRSFGREDFLTTWKAGEIELPVIAKPRDGFASRGIEIIQSEQDFDKITDGHIVQELALPHDGDPNREHCLNMISKGINPQVAEVSIQYVFDRSGGVIGKMASYNKLNNGVPIEILPIEDEAMWADVEQLLPTLVKLGARGPVNLQGRITNKGIKLFEINARFTGITGLRAALGFNEVEACIRHWMGLEFTPLLINQNRVGIRQTADKAVDLNRNPEVKMTVLDLNSAVLKKAKTILITGASGAIGSRLVMALSEDKRCQLFTLDRDKAKAEILFKDCAVTCYDHDDLNAGKFSLGNVDSLVHLASARPHHSESEQAQSLRFSLDLFTRAASQGVSELINLSSQSVYGAEEQAPWAEGDVVAPDSSYAVSKYALEQHLRSLSCLFPLLRSTSIRLSSVVSADAVSSEIEAIGKMVKLAKSQGKLTIYGGSQKMERIDIRDAVSGLVVVINSDSSDWKDIYNLGADRQYSLEAAVGLIAEEVEGELKTTVELSRVELKEPARDSGLNMEAFKADFGWTPQYQLIDSIKVLLD